jgi:hypothetical protein
MSLPGDRIFSRRLATDKFIRFFFFINVLLLAGIITWYFWKRGKIHFPDLNDVPRPPLPAESSSLGVWRRADAGMRLEGDSGSDIARVYLRRS